MSSLDVVFDIPVIDQSPPHTLICVADSLGRMDEDHIGGVHAVLECPVLVRDCVKEGGVLRWIAAMHGAVDVELQIIAFMQTNHGGVRDCGGKRESGLEGWRLIGGIICSAGG